MRNFNDFLQDKGEEASFLFEGKWLSKLHLKKGKCTPIENNPDCPKGSPQYNLAMRFKHGDLHKSKKKKD